MNGFGCWLSAASRISQVGWTLSHQQESAGERERERSHCWPFKSKKTFSRNLKHKEEERERERIRPCSQTANSPRSRFFDNLPSFVTHVWQRKKCENIIQWRKTPSRLKKRKKHIPCPVRAHKWCQEYSNYKGHKEWQIGTSRVFFLSLTCFFLPPFQPSLVEFVKMLPVTSNQTSLTLLPVETQATSSTSIFKDDSCQWRYLVRRIRRKKNIFFLAILSRSDGGLSSFLFTLKIISHLSVRSCVDLMYHLGLLLFFSFFFVLVSNTLRNIKSKNISWEGACAPTS